MRIEIRGVVVIEIGESQQASAPALMELANQTRVLNRIVATAILGESNPQPAPSAGPRVINIENDAAPTVPTVPTVEEVLGEQPNEPVDFSRVETTVQRGMKQMSAIESKGGAKSKTRKRREWSPERRAQASEMMKQRHAQSLASGKPLSPGRPKKNAAPASTPVAAAPAQEPEPVISVPAIEELSGAVVPEDVPNVEGLDEDELAELQKPLPPPEAIFGRNVLTESRNGTRTIDEVRQMEQSTPGPAGRMAR